MPAPCAHRTLIMHIPAAAQRNRTRCRLSARRCDRTDRIDAMRYIVIGAGAIGGTIGGRLAATGHEVVLVARGAHLDALRSRGLRLATPDGTSTLDIPAVAGPGELSLREDDVLLLATKTQDAEPLLAEWAWQPVRNTTGSAADALPVVCAQNGVAGERIALRRF